MKEILIKIAKAKREKLSQPEEAASNQKEVMKSEAEDSEYTGQTPMNDKLAEIQKNEAFMPQETEDENEGGEGIVLMVNGSELKGQELIDFVMNNQDQIKQNA